MSSTNPAYIARGTINPSRFVRISTTAGHNFSVVQAAAATEKIVGVSQEGFRDPPGVLGSGAAAALDGHTLKVYGGGDVALIEAGAAITQGDWLKADAQGRAVTVAFTLGAGTIHAGGFALEAAGGVGELIRMYVEPTPVPGATA